MFYERRWLTLSKEYSVVTKFIANTNDFMKGMQKAENQTKSFSNKFGKNIADTEKKASGLGNTFKNAFKFTGKVAAATGVFRAVDGAINMVTSSIDGAISRVDTLNQFPKVLKQMGYTAEEANKSTKRLAEGIDGLPTKLNDITANTQRFVNVFQDVDKATESAIAVNNAFLASGASSDDAARGIDQYTKMLSTGKAEMDSWNTLQETMPYALQKTAEAFGYTGRSAQNDLYSALKDGHITMDEFNDKIIELSGETGGFAEVAKTATKGIGTSWKNVQTAVVNGVAKVIQSFDTWLDSNGFGGIAGIMDNIKAVAGDVFSTISSAVPIALDWFSQLFTKVRESTAFTTLKDVIQGLVDTVQELWNKFSESSALENVQGVFERLADAILSIDFNKFLEKWSPLIAGIVGGIGAFIAIQGAISGLMGTIRIGMGVVSGLSAAIAFITSPVGLVVLAIGALIAIGVSLWQNWDTIKAKTIAIWSAISDWFSNFWSKTKELFNSSISFIGNVIANGFNKSMSFIVNILTSTSNFIQNILNKIVSIFLNALNWIDQTTNGKFKIITDTIRYYITMASQILQSVWNFIKQTFQNTLDFLKALVKGDFQGMKDAIDNQMNNIWNLLKNIWDSIKTFLSNTIGDIVNNAITGFQNLWDNVKTISGNIWSSITTTFNDIVEAAKALPGRIGDGISSMASEVKDGALDVVNSLASTLGKGVNGVIGGINWVLGKIGVESKIPEWDVPQYANGTGSHPGGLAVVGDGKGSNAGSELIQTPDGKMSLSPSTDTLVNLPKGSKVLSAKNTRNFLSSIPAYANGIGEWVGNVWDYVSNPSKLLDKALGSLGVEIPKGGSFIGDIAKGGFTKVKDGAVEFIKKQFEKLTSFGSSGGGSVPSAGSGVQRWAGVASKALAMTGQFSKTNLDRLLYQMQTESGGNPKAINLWDINAKRGIPSKGLMQVIDPTFQAYKMPGYNNIWEPLDNILASIRYAVRRYGSLTNAYRGVGYEKGGLIDHEHIAKVGEGGKREAVLPLQNKRFMAPFADAVFSRFADKFKEVINFNPESLINSFQHNMNQFATGMLNSVERGITSNLAYDNASSNTQENNNTSNVLNLSLNIENMNGTKKDANYVLNEAVKGFEKMGFKF